MKVLGIDFGRVISGGEGDDTIFTDNFLETPELEGATETIARIKPMFDDVVIISKCGPKIQRKTNLWLYHHRFFEKTDIDSDRLFFCRERSEKVGIAQRLGVTHYVDNRMDIIRSMIGVVPNLFLFAPNVTATVRQGNFHIVPSWAKLERVIEVIDKWSKA
jgi:hypothetical protein